jgi:pyruvate formate lyase activating enzyme
MLTATIFNIQRFSLHDGPGIRTTVFLKGCPLRCSWCHNPESFDPRPEPAMAAARCIECHSCEPVCELGLAHPGVIGIADQDLGARCLRCGRCIEACPTEARQMLGRQMGVEELLQVLARDKVYHEESLGGITFSGGEPLSAGNAPFVVACLEKLVTEGVHTALDTCGHIQPAVLTRAADLVDLFLFDLKIMDSEAHRQATGQDNDLIHRNLKWLVHNGHEVRVRVPLIPDLTDDRANLEAMADLLLELNGPEGMPTVHLLPYHGFAAEKYQRLGRVHPLVDVHPMSPFEIETRAGWLESRGLTVHIGG